MTPRGLRPPALKHLGIALSQHRTSMEVRLRSVSSFLVDGATCKGTTEPSSWGLDRPFNQGLPGLGLAQGRKLGQESCLSVGCALVRGAT